MKPLLHAKISVKKFGGHVDDYIKFHEWMDSTKGHIPDMRHRMVLHNAWGIHLGKSVFGSYFTNSEGKDISVGNVLEQHVIDDLGYIPTLEQCMAGLPAEPWMGAKVRAAAKKSVRMKITDISKYNIEIVD